MQEDNTTEQDSTKRAATHRATTGVSPSVMGVRTGKSALLQMKASARVELPPLSTRSSHPFSCSRCCTAPASPAAADASSALSSEARAGGGQEAPGQRDVGTPAMHALAGGCSPRRSWRSPGQPSHAGRTDAPPQRVLTRQQANLLQRALHVNMVVDCHIAACTSLHQQLAVSSWEG